MNNENNSGLCRRTVHMSACIAAAFTCFAAISSAQAQQSVSQQQILYDQMVRSPTDYGVTTQYVRTAEERGDYEAAIGALERMLYYNPKLGRVKFKLGVLYYRLHSYEMARRYFQEALESPDIDDALRADIESYLSDSEKQMQPSRFSGFAQIGIRSQSNGNLSPNGDFTRFGGANIPLPGTSKGRPDFNTFQLVAFNHDLDLGNQRGDILETRFTGYATQQFRFNDLDIDLFEASIGPRMAISPEFLPGATIKPYIIGGMTAVGGSRYFASAGAGVTTQFPVGPNFNFGPTYEWRRVDFNLTDLVAQPVFNSGDWNTTGMWFSGNLRDGVRYEGRGFYRRGSSELDFQAFKQWGGEAALTFNMALLSPAFRNLNVSPYVRYLRTDFDAPDAAVDPTTARLDNEWTYGTKFDIAITKTFGLSATIQYDATSSSLPNYRQHDLSILGGPTARF
jgi:hypothetical protein